MLPWQSVRQVHLQAEEISCSWTAHPGLQLSMVTLFAACRPSVHCILIVVCLSALICIIWHCPRTHSFVSDMSVFSQPAPILVYCLSTAGHVRLLAFRQGWTIGV